MRRELESGSRVSVLESRTGRRPRHGSLKDIACRARAGPCSFWRGSLRCLSSCVEDRAGVAATKSNPRVAAQPGAADDADPRAPVTCAAAERALGLAAQPLCLKATARPLGRGATCLATRHRGDLEARKSQSLCRLGSVAAVPDDDRRTGRRPRRVDRRAVGRGQRNPAAAPSPGRKVTGDPVGGDAAGKGSFVEEGSDLGDCSRSFDRDAESLAAAFGPVPDRQPDPTAASGPLREMERSSGERKSAALSSHGPRPLMRLKRGRVGRSKLSRARRGASAALLDCLGR
jgi:hypothetical protein